MLELRYASREVERLCTEERRMQRKLGAEVAKALRRRIAELRSIDIMADLLDGPGRWEQLTGDLTGHWSSRLSKNWRLLVEASGPAANVAIVVRVEDYH